MKSLPTNARASENTMPHTWSVSELTNALRHIIEREFPIVDIEGELSGARLSPSGHFYFTIKDAGAQLSAVMFSNAFLACSSRGALVDGARIKIRGRITVGLGSHYQIVVTRARLVGSGELMQQFLELREKLRSEGLFEQSRKRPLPFLPRRIGIITSPSGAVIHDMCRVLMRRFPLIEIRIYPTLVQGEGASASLLAGLRYFANEKDWRADVIIFGRGGGSFEDLFCFNDELFVRAVAASPIPTISAVGHETDVTLSDFVADVRAGTPSMAAELVVKEYSAISSQLSRAENSLASTLRNAYELTVQRVDSYDENLKQVLWRYETSAKAKVDALSNALKFSANKMLTNCAISSQKIEKAKDAMRSALMLCLEKAKSKLNILESNLQLLSPYSVLDRGYSLTTTADGKIVRKAKDAPQGTILKTLLREETIISRVID